MADNGTSERLTPKQEKFIEALLAGAGIGAAALTAGISARTAQRWQKQDALQAALKAAQKRLFNQALTGLMLKVDTAIETLDDAMVKGETYSVRVRASQIVLEQAIAVFKIAELEEKYAELEALVKGGPARGINR